MSAILTTMTSAERDLATAGALQRMLLPPPTVSVGGWQVSYRYEPAGMVSGDYVGLVPDDDQVYFMLADVSGKGVAASLLMAQLHAMFRSMIPMRLPLTDLMSRASALLCSSSLPAQYATAVAGILRPDGTVSISNAGHPSPLLIAGERSTSVSATGLPVGMFCASRFESTELSLRSGDTLFAFTDGLTEATNSADEEFGSTRTEATAASHAILEPSGMLDAVLNELGSFRGPGTERDDLTLLAVRRL